jgi:tyrosine decarboxylase/aspartate 1-decarboxylase
MQLGKQSLEILTEALQRLEDQAASSHHLHLAKLKYPVRLLQEVWKEVNFDAGTVTCLRSCLMKPEHLDYIDGIWEILDKAANEIETSS